MATEPTEPATAQGEGDTLEHTGKNFLERLKVTEAANKRLETENQLLKNEANDLMTHVNKLKDENEQLRKKVQDSNVEKQNKVVQLETEKAELVRKYENELDNLRKNKEDLDHKVQIQDTLHKRNQEERTQESDKIDSLIHELEKDRDRLRSENKFNRDEMLKTIRELDQVRKEKEELENSGVVSNKKLDEELKQTRAEFLKTLKDYDAMKKNNESLEAEKERYALQNSILQTDLDKLLRESKQGQQDVTQLLTEMNNLEDRTHTLKSDSMQLTRVLRNKDEAIKAMEKEIDELRISNGTLLRELDKLRGERMALDVIDSQLQDISGAHKKLLEENKRLRNKVMFSDDHRIIPAQTDRLEMHDKLDIAELKLNKAMKRIHTLETYLDDIYNSGDELYEYPSARDMVSGSRLSFPDVPENRTPTPQKSKVQQFNLKKLSNMKVQRRYPRYN